MTGLALATTLLACDRRIEMPMPRASAAGRARIDSLTVANAELERRMALFERISAEKDTLLREVRDAHLLIEGVAEELRKVDEHGTPVVEVDAGDVAVDRAGEARPPAPTYQELILGKLEQVRLRLSAMEDSARVRGERLVAMAGENEQLRAEAEDHLRTIASQKEIIESYLTRIAELEDQVKVLTESNERLTQENGALADSVRRLTTRANAAWFVAGTRDDLVKAGVLSEEGGLLGIGRTLTPARAMRLGVFNRIDRTRDTVIALPAAKQYQIVSRHDPGLVDITLSRGESATLRIRDPERFWGASDYLIIVY
jgi:hypothetical protein